MPFSRFWDITKSLYEGITVWPGDIPFERKARQTKKAENLWSNSDLHMSCHTGTHMDAPRHVFEKGGDINSFPLAVLVGACRVVEIEAERIDKKQVQQIDPIFGERILFKTLNCNRENDDDFREDFIHFDGEGAKELVKSQVVLIGIDGPSVDAFGAENSPAHIAFCDAGIAIVENIDLHEVEPGSYTLICLPLKMEGSDGSPVRAILAR